MSQTPLIPPPQPGTLYFGYGSNLWLHQMAQRCPTSSYLGVARLGNYTWQINTRGYANVVPSPSTNSSSSTTTTSEPHNYSNEVYGLVYSLLPSDEQHLDINEGVPIAYVKAHLRCEFWPGTLEDRVNASEPAPESREMLVYIDHKRTSPGKPREEYVYRMNEGIRDAVALGVPEGESEPF
ncbi:hypothetical protein E8E13_004306 [Curvularia kusanoi]|uniref:gamma-glutamylcyclotransferase n=1 Tax=Curvularia kusanoi TaxID=90978 RepID=A0A9P4T851_CURKU|nr:hypothetical protein E8E13_004306 [Curvularia kusanoi]